MARTKLLERGWTREPRLPLPIRIPIRDRHLWLGRGYLPVNPRALQAQLPRTVFSKWTAFADSPSHHLHTSVPRLCHDAPVRSACNRGSRRASRLFS
jgi:hypothetical protein